MVLISFFKESPPLHIGKAVETGLRRINLNLQTKHLTSRLHLQLESDGFWHERSWSRHKFKKISVPWIQPQSPSPSSVLQKGDDDLEELTKCLRLSRIHRSDLTAACLGLLDESRVIKVTHGAKRRCCRSPQSKATSNSFFSRSQIYIFIFRAPAPHV